MQSHIFEAQPVACPAGAARVFVESEFRARSAVRTRTVEARVPIFGLFFMERAVDVRLGPSRYDRESGGYGMEIEAEPGSSWFPRFSGRLTIRPDGAESCTFEVSGSYIPPGFAFGSVFDALAGRRIAQATLHDLLAIVARSVGNEYLRRLGAGALADGDRWDPPAPKFSAIG